MTIWPPRPVKLTAPLKFVLGSVLSFILGMAAGLIQANVGLSVVLHNTQWVIGTHAHMMLLGGPGMLLFAVIYALVPILTGPEMRSQRLVNLHFWTWLPGVLVMAYGLALAGTRAMLRRTIYETALYRPHMIVAMAGGILLMAGLVIFVANLAATLDQERAGVVPARREGSVRAGGGVGWAR